MKKRKVKLKTYTGAWTDDDIDITPTLKFTIGSKESGSIKVTVTYLALCWLKWALIFQFSTIDYTNYNQTPCK